MKSVLISTDFIYKQDGTLHPTEINTNTIDDITSIGDLDNNNFVEDTSDYFNHELLDSFMKNNQLIKIICISKGGDDRLYKSFSGFYNYEYEHILIGANQLTIPEIDDDPSVLIIRIAYDTYALIDDLYARDNYEFHNLIKDEVFSSPVTFNENGFDTIIEFEPSQDGVIPNYVIKARTPGYTATDYPKGYRLDNMEELNLLKQSLGDDEFIAKYEFNNPLSLVDNRTHHLRTMSLICGPTLEVLNLVHYISLNSVSVKNEKLVYDSEIDLNKQLNGLFLSKYYPTWYSKTGLNFHSDSTDLILNPDDTLISFSDLEIGNEIKNIFFTDKLENDSEQESKIFEHPIIGTSEVVSLTKQKNGIFINITATHETFGTFSWYDGIGNTYVVKKPNQTDDVVLWTKAGIIDEGDKVIIYDKLSNKTIQLVVQKVWYDIKDLDLYLISLKPKPQFLVQLNKSNENLFLIQHNGCTQLNTCYAGAGSCVRGTLCNDCGKNSALCINCGGSATVECITF